MDSAELKRQRERKKRVARMKKGIISFVFIMLVVLLALCILLGVALFHVYSRMKTLEQRMDDVEIALASEGDYVVADEVSLSDGIESADASADASGDSVDSFEYGVDAHQYIYLTFDDGPSDNTLTILDTLDAYGVKATFFVIGTENEEYQELYRQIVERGHTLGMHSYSHKYSSLYESKESFADEIEREQDLIEEVTGLRPWLFRFPGGSSNEVSNADMNTLIQYLNDVGIVYMDWNVVGGDATSQAYTSSDVIDSVLEDIGKYQTAVVLLHDSNAKTATAKALGDLIEELQKRDADILPVTEDTPLVQHIGADSVVQ